ncbi:hypothetical protein Pan241w_11290 [Gimesia alba]|uniref:Uncharacterized protein n=1 Tax=Gimesia alba TaxID=2527973 RepID=A0A517RB04_9PLAN|nr:hypothetical protein [Gimesia alba]QDT41070.1 hypothetical protein Pan241w_11290 [Gimesia alba]
MTTPQITGPSIETESHAAFDGTIAVDMYDLMFHDSDDVKPASSQADKGTALKNQVAFARNFAGLALDARLVTDTDADTNFPLATHIIAVMDCTSATFEKGDMVAAVEAASGTALENQKVVKTLDPTLAIGRVTKRYASATTRVECEFIAAQIRNMAANPAKGPLVCGGSNVETLTANKTLTVDDARVQVLDPGGAARDVTLPAEALSYGDSFIIDNTADAAEAITVKDDSPATVGTVSQNEVGIFFCDGTTWRMLQGARV